MPGMRISASTRSGVSRRTASSAASPLASVETSYPRARSTPARSSLLARWSSTTRMRPVTREPESKNGASKDNHAARVAARLQIGEGLRRFFDGVAPGNELVELQLAAHVEAEHARKIDPRHARAEVAAGERLLLERQRHGAHRRAVRRLRHADHDGQP